MSIWQADFYRVSGDNLWQLLICTPEGKIIREAQCPQSEVDTNWLVTQLQLAIANEPPARIEVFRPQSLGLLTNAGQILGIKVRANRETAALKDLLKKRNQSYLIEQLPPQPLPENLWGEQWSFVALPISELLEFFQERPIPICNIPQDISPLKLGLASTVSIPGIVIYGGRKSRQLAEWISVQEPAEIKYIPYERSHSGGLVLESGLVDRWIIATFEDREIAQAAERYEHRKMSSRGLHFLVVQPDNSGITYTAFWLLGIKVSNF